MFAAQVDSLQQAFGLTPGDIDLPGFALFALFTLPLGLTVVIPDMDPTRPARVNPERIVEAIHNQGVTFSFGSPALWHRVSNYCQEHGVKLPTLRAITMAGAPIPGYLHERLLGGILAPGAQVYTPYGATECLPVTSYTGDEIRRETWALTQQGKGTCVGWPLPGVQVRVIRLSDRPLPHWETVSELPRGEIGEIVVQGPVVSRAYYRLPDQTALHKIYETSDHQAGPFWHRIGDVGYFDEQGRLWFCGRRAHRVETGSQTLYTVCCEAIANGHPAVFRSALVGVGPDRLRQTPVMLVELHPDQRPRNAVAIARLREELLTRLREQPLTADIQHLLIHPAFPVDIRHNAKIFREQLAAWATSRIRPASG